MFARMLIAIVDHYEDRPWIEDQLAALGKRHRKVQLTSAMYKHFTTALIVTLEEAAGELWTVEVEDAWMTALADIARTMQRA
jgi:hemoglobin-like flavoprotein